MRRKMASTYSRRVLSRRGHSRVMRGAMLRGQPAGRVEGPERVQLPPADELRGNARRVRQHPAGQRRLGLDDAELERRLAPPPRNREREQFLLEVAPVRQVQVSPPDVQRIPG